MPPHTISRDLAQSRAQIAPDAVRPREGRQPRVRLAGDLGEYLGDLADELAEVCAPRRPGTSRAYLGDISGKSRGNLGDISGISRRYLGRQVKDRLTTPPREFGGACVIKPKSSFIRDIVDLPGVLYDTYSYMTPGCLI